ncbi:crotonase/enoyl-CoA hydratase family protein [Streptomyces sp. NPDC014892]|uniref:crotonase/enoyl-CoA hydratase family protein n=1 Tax=Streptomyces sp. NPDC014892 TaxID=3364930 RepID=UPI0036FCF134
MNAPSWALPPSLQVEQRGAAAILTLCRPEKRNAIDDATIRGTGRFFDAVPECAEAVVVAAEADHLSAGLCLGEMSEQGAVVGIHHSRMWHAVFAKLQGCGVPVIVVLKGAVVGGGLEPAAAAHLRVAERSAFYALPEGARGLFVGGGASVRVSRLVGVQRMTDVMFTGRVLDAEEGLRDGLTDYLVDDGQGFNQALELAEKMAGNSPMSTCAILHALPRIAESDPETGLLMESLMATVAQSSPEAEQRMDDFLSGKAAKVAQR